MWTVRLVDDPIRAIHTDQSKEEEFANITEISEAYTGIYEYYCVLVPGYYVFTVYLNSHSRSRDIPPGASLSEVRCQTYQRI